MTDFKKAEELFKKPEAYKSVNSSSTLDQNLDEDENIYFQDDSTVFVEMLNSIKNLFVSTN